MGCQGNGGRGTLIRLGQDKQKGHLPMAFFITSNPTIHSRDLLQTLLLMLLILRVKRHRNKKSSNISIDFGYLLAFFEARIYTALLGV
jgi:hypothetical protein